MLGHGRNGKPGADLPVLGVDPVGGGNEDIVVHIQEGALHLNDGVAVALGGKVCVLQNGDLVFILYALGNDLDGMDVRKLGLLQDDVDPGCSLAQSLGGCPAQRRSPASLVSTVEAITLRRPL